jgi:glycosyltransferase involved in cell wall biosynthesis
MHVLFITGEYPPQPGGVGDYTQQLARALVKRHHHCSVLTINQGKWLIHRLCNKGQQQTHSFALDRSAKWDWRSWDAVYAAIFDQNPEIIHIQYQTGAYNMHPAINLLPRRLHWLQKRPILCATFHDLLEPYLFPKAGPVRRWVTNRLACDVDGAIATNMADYEKLAQRLGSKSPTLIPIGSNIDVTVPEDYSREAWRAQLGVAPDQLLIAYFGLLGQSKGADLLFDGLAKHPDWRLLVIGGSATSPQDQKYAAWFEEEIRRHKLNEQVIRTGQVEQQEVSCNLLAADLVALPFRDGASLRRGSLLAAMTHGCAIVTSEPSDSQALQATQHAALRPGEHALFVPIEDSAALEAAIQRLANDPQLRAELGARASLFSKRFSWENIATQHETLYKQLIAGSQSRAA